MTEMNENKEAQGSELSGGLGAARTFRCSPMIRIVDPNMDLSGFGIASPMHLQQAWLCGETGEIEWRDVPHIRESQI